MTLSTYNGYEYFEQDYEPEEWAIEKDDPYKHAAIQVEIMPSLFDIWVTFKDSIDVDNNLRGRVHRNPTTASLHRVYRVVKDLDVTIEPDDRSPIIIATRKVTT